MSPLAAEGNISTPCENIYDLFAQRVQADPTGTALVLREQTMSSASLHRLVCNVERQLLNQNIGPSDVVGISMLPGPVQIATMLAILKMGATYVPGDYREPIATVLKRFQSLPVNAVAVAAGKPDLWPEFGSRTVDVDVDVDVDVESDFESGWSSIAALDRPAYIMFTTGSTADSKGVCMTHSSLLPLLYWHGHKISRAPGWRTAQLCSTAFDFSFHEIFSTLCLGGTLVLIPPEIRVDLSMTLEYLRNCNVDTLFAPVSLLGLLAERARRESVSLQLDHVLTTGEALRITDTLRHFFTESGAALHNQFGATEFQDALSFTLEGSPASWPADVPIGTPLEHVKAIVAEPGTNEPVACSHVGELVVSGVSVAKGYWDPTLPSNSNFGTYGSGDRYYRTGDLVHQDREGVFHYHGRVASAVAVDGQDLSLRELTSRILELPGVVQAVLIPSVDGSLASVIAHIAVTPDGDERAAKDLVRAEIEAVPLFRREAIRVTVHEHLPITVNGKADMRYLHTLT
ncbi:AMP-binding protein [Nocardioides bruguierae]|uniref:AMP-binding protein n=1 Tax=Nocardioides bruguierae TaxID=2945102 RepID=A0A9X2II77_9ACTN|nr:AMP-binding protein [Nocardioides bruguierae]MCM0622525.1 AMP-binding protein [Nocardioides bruguierae]